jgi:predicted RND superfamily exporter protein
MKARRLGRTLSRLVIRLRLPILGGTLFLTLLALFFLKDLRINSDILSYLPADDPATILNTYISNTYGGSQLAIVALEAEDVFTPEVLGDIAVLSEHFSGLEGVLSVTSLTRVLDIRKQEDWLEIGWLVDPDAPPRDPKRLAALRRYTLSRPMYPGRIISADAGTALVISRLREDADKAELAREIRRSTAALLSSQAKVTFAGLPFQLVEISDLVRRDLLRLIPLAALLITGCLYAGFRSFRGVLLPLLPALIATVWTLAVMSLTGVRFSVISNIIPVVILAVGSAYSIHVLSAFRERTAHAPDQADAARALRLVALPVALAALTTMAGFLAFIWGSYLTMIREFGLFCALGVCFALLLSLTFIPALLVQLPAPAAVRSARYGPLSPRRPPAHIRLLIRLVERRRRAVLACAGLLVLFSAAGFPLIRREVDILSYFRPGSEIRAAEEMMKKTFGGSQTLQILVSGDIKDPAVLEKMKAVEEYLRTRPELHNVHSVVELLEEMSFAMIDRRILPASRGQAANLWFLLEGEETLSLLVNPEADEAVIQASLENQNSREIAEVVRDVSARIASLRDDKVGMLRMQLAGSALLYSELYAALKRSQCRSLVLALLLVFACNLLLLRSFRAALTGLAPIVFTLFLLFGIMGAGGLPLDVVTVLLGSISLGVGIDYSLHFLNRYRRFLLLCRRRRRGRQPEDAATAALAATGEAIFINMVTVSAGFLSLLLAGLTPLRRFALLIVCTMLCSGLSALLLLPSLLLLRARAAAPARAAPARAAAAHPPGRAPLLPALRILKRVFAQSPAHKAPGKEV